MTKITIAINDTTKGWIMNSGPYKIQRRKHEDCKGNSNVHQDLLDSR